MPLNACQQFSVEEALSHKSTENSEQSMHRDVAWATPIINLLECYRSLNVSYGSSLFAHLNENVFFFKKSLFPLHCLDQGIKIAMSSGAKILSRKGGKVERALTLAQTDGSASKQS